MITLLFFSFQKKAKADFEYFLDASARSYALSGTLTGSVAYGWTLWGERSKAPWYGYLKPEVQLSTAGNYNSGLVQIKFFPISFLGAVAGVEGVSNTRDYSAYDCVIFRCRGRGYQRFVEAHLALSAAGFFIFGKGGLSDWRQEPEQDRDFINPTWGLATRQQGDRLRYLKSAAGYQLTKAWSLVYAYAWGQMQEVEGQSQMHLALTQWQGQNLSLAIGGGVFESELKKKQATAVISLKFQGPGPSLDLF